jgi:tryptophan synthase alpha subunit
MRHFPFVIYIYKRIKGTYGVVGCRETPKSQHVHGLVVVGCPVVTSETVASLTHVRRLKIVYVPITSSSHHHL